MKKMIASAIFALVVLASSFAGDAAAFFDIGFSEDGKTYVFGQYGKTDVKYQAWAEIYTVDVAENDFVKGEVFKTLPSKSTVSFTGKKAFEDLHNKVNWKLKKYKCSPTSPENLLYVRDVNAEGLSEIIFQDFDSSSEDHLVFYNIRVVPSYEGTGKNIKSKFYIEMQKQDEDGKVLASWKVGNPEIKRSGISSYQIDRIFTDNTKTSLVFVVRKTLEDSTGTSVRYMVETIKLK